MVLCIMMGAVGLERSDGFKKCLRGGLGRTQ